MTTSKPARHAIAASHVFDGAVIRRDTVVIIEDGLIARVLPRAELAPDTPIDSLPDGLWLVPGFIDLQVNGGGDVLFNDRPTPDGIAAIAAAHRKFGTTGLLPTLITDTPEKMRAAIEAVREARQTQLGVLGIHLEGPFLSPHRPGVHAVRHIRAPQPSDIETLAAVRAGAMLITLAPEEVPKDFIRQLIASGIRVSLGHSAATYQQTRAARTPAPVQRGQPLIRQLALSCKPFLHRGLRDPVGEHEPGSQLQRREQIDRHDAPSWRTARCRNRSL